MALYVNGATNFMTVNANGSEVNVVYSNGTIVYSKAWITFNEQGGSGVSDRFVWYGRTYGQYAPLPTPSRPGFTFGGWFTQTLGNGSQITASTVKTSTGTTQTNIVCVLDFNSRENINTNNRILELFQCVVYQY